jgi:hypothetical protein
VIDWPVAAADGFLLLAMLSLIVAPLAGVAASSSRPFRRGTIVLLVASATVLAWAWRRIPGGPTAALAGHVVVLVVTLAFAMWGRLLRRLFPDDLSAGLAALLAGLLVTMGPFLAGAAVARVPFWDTGWLLATNPLMAVASAAGIDLLHLDVIYRTSPLAHRGVALPAWSAVCGAYAITGLAAYGVSRLRPWSRSL